MTTRKGRGRAYPRMRMPQANRIMKAGTDVIVGGSTLILGVGALNLASGVVGSLKKP